MFFLFPVPGFVIFLVAMRWLAADTTASYHKMLSDYQAELAADPVAARANAAKGWRVLGFFACSLLVFLAAFQFSFFAIAVIVFLVAFLIG
jgi:hypothetical protein